MSLLPHILGCHPIAKTDIVRGEGVNLYDRHGKKFVDFEAGIWCAALGYDNPQINSCIHDMLKRVIHLGPQFTSSLAEEAAVELLSHTPFKDGKVVFLSSGSEAVELSIILSLLLTEKTNLLTFDRSYLGAYGIAGYGGEERLWIKIDIDACLKCTDDECVLSCPCLSQVNFDNTAAFVLEPVLASGGIIIPPPKVVQLLSKEVTRAGGVIVANEVTTGLGRTGKWLGIEHFDVTPDICAFGKTLGNGYPVSAVAMRKSAGEKLEEIGFKYVQSHQNDPLGCAIAKEVVTILNDYDLIGVSRQKGEFLRRSLQEIKLKSGLAS